MKIKITSNTHSKTLHDDMRQWLMSANLETFQGQVIYDYLKDILDMLDITIVEFTTSHVVFQKGDDDVEVDKAELLDWINSCILESDYDAAVLQESLERMMLKIVE